VKTSNQLNYLVATYLLFTYIVEENHSCPEEDEEERRRIVRLLSK